MTEDTSLAPYVYQEGSVALAKKTREDIENLIVSRVRAQADSSNANKLKLIQYDSQSLAPKARVLQEVDDMVALTGYRLPYDLIYLIKNRTGKIIATPTSAGYFTMIQCHPEVLMAIKDDYKVDTLENRTLITAKARFVFASGRVVEGTRVKCLEDERARNPNISFQDVINKALTQARGKAAELACPFPIQVGVAEEMLDFENQQALIRQETRTKGSSVGTPPKISDYGRWLAEVHKLKAKAQGVGLDITDTNALAKFLGVKVLSDVTKDLDGYFALFKKKLEAKE